MISFNSARTAQTSSVKANTISSPPSVMPITCVPAGSPTPSCMASLILSEQIVLAGIAGLRDSPYILANSMRYLSII